MYGGIRVWAAACAVAAVATVAGCGGGDDEGTAKDEPIKVSAAVEPPEAFAKRVARLIATTDKKKECTEINLVYAISKARFVCPADKAFRKSMQSFRVVDAAEYGTGALVYYKSGKLKDGATLMLAAAPNRAWGMTKFGVLTKPWAGTDDSENQQGYDEAVVSYLKAVRDRDCDAYRKVAYLNADTKRIICEGYFPETKSLAKSLKQNPTSKTRYEGGNGTFGFYSLAFAKPKPKSVTISVAKASDDDYKVLDVVDGPTMAQREQARKDFKESMQPDQPETSPSRKADS